MFIAIKTILTSQCAAFMTKILKSQMCITKPSSPYDHFRFFTSTFIAKHQPLNPALNLVKTMGCQPHANFLVNI